MIGDRCETAVDVITVELSLHGLTHFLGSPIMERDAREKFERGETGERSEKDDRRQVRDCSRCEHSRVIPTQINTFLWFSHHGER